MDPGWRDVCIRSERTKKWLSDMSIQLRRMRSGYSEHFEVLAINLILLVPAVVVLVVAHFCLSWNVGSVFINVMCGLISACSLAILLEIAAAIRKHRELAVLRSLCFGDLKERTGELLSQIVFLIKRIDDNIFDWQLVNDYPYDPCCGILIQKCKDGRDIELSGREVKDLIEEKSTLLDYSCSQESQYSEKVKALFKAVAVRNAGSVKETIESLNSKSLQIVILGLATREEVNSLCTDVNFAIEAMKQEGSVNYLNVLLILFEKYEWLCALLHESVIVKGGFSGRVSADEAFAILRECMRA